MASKMEQLSRRLDGNMAESMGAGRKPATPAAPLADNAKHEGVTRNRNAAEMLLDRIAPDPDQPREEFDDEEIERLAASLKEHGQIQPITVRWSDAMGLYTIVSGERRWRAARRAGLPSLQVVIHQGPVAPGRILEIQLVENCLRVDLAAIERAKGYRKLMDAYGWSGAQLANHLHVDPSSVTRALALLDLPPSVQARVESGELAPSAAYEVSKLADPETQARVASRVLTEGLHHADVVEAVRLARPAAKGTKGRGGKAKVTVATIRAAGGKLTMEHRKGVDDETLREMLIEALKIVDARLEGRGAAA